MTDYFIIRKALLVDAVLRRLEEKSLSKKDKKLVEAVVDEIVLDEKVLNAITRGH
jgi:hypothetical protein